MPSVPPGLDVRLAPLEDLERFAPLMRAAFGLRVSERHFRWKFAENPSGPVVGFEAIGPNGPAAFYGVIPETYVVRGKRTRVHQTVDIMIHPDYRASGLYMALSRRTYEHLLAEEGGYTLVAFPNEKLLSVGTKRTGWTLMHTIPLVFLPRIIHRARLWRSRAKDLAFTTVKRATDLEPYLSVRDQSLAGCIRGALARISAMARIRPPLQPGPGVPGLARVRAGRDVPVLDRRAVTLPDPASGLHHPTDVRRRLRRPGGLSVRGDQRVPALHLGARRSRSESGAPAQRILSRTPREGPGSARYSLVARSEPRLVHGQDWLDPANFDAQPIMHD